MQQLIQERINLLKKDLLHYKAISDGKQIIGIEYAISELSSLLDAVNYMPDIIGLNIFEP